MSIYSNWFNTFLQAVVKIYCGLNCFWVSGFIEFALNYQWKNILRQRMNEGEKQTENGWNIFLMCVDCVDFIFNRHRYIGWEWSIEYVINTIGSIITILNSGISKFIISAEQTAMERKYKRAKNFHCYNCGVKNKHYSRHCTEEQQHTRCPVCNVVAFSAAGHKVSCKNTTFISKKIGMYELPLKEFQTVRLVFSNTTQIYSAEETTKGMQYFLMTKFLSLGTNIKFRRIYDESSNLTFDLKMKPAVTIGIGRKGSQKHLASLMFCDNEVRVNHYQSIDENGIVSYSLITKPQRDEKHDIELKLESDHRVIFLSLCWNNVWWASIAMSKAAVTIGPYFDPNKKWTQNNNQIKSTLVLWFNYYRSINL